MASEIPFVSVIVPVYNVEKYIRKCLDSIVQQTLRSIEIIIIIDGSTDNSETMAEEYLHAYDNIRLIKTPNRGLGAARNEGIKYAKGEYLAFIDSDDWIEKEMFEDMYLLAKEYHADIVACNFIFEYENESKEVQPDMCSQLIKDKETAIKDILLSRNMNNCAWNKIYRRSLIMNSSIRFTEGRYFEDLYPMLQWVERANTIYLTNKIYYHYRRGLSSSITSKFSQKHLEDYIVLIENVRKWLEERKWQSQFNKEFVTFAYRIYNQLIFNIFFSRIKNRYVYYKKTVNYFFNSNYFNFSLLSDKEENRLILISILGKASGNCISRRLSFYMISSGAFLMRKLK